MIEATKPNRSNYYSTRRHH